MANNFPSLCPTDCDGTVDFPAIEADQDCTTFSLYDSQVSDVWIMPNEATEGAPFSDWISGSFTVTANPSAIDNTVTDNTATKWLVGKGGVAAPDKTVEELPKFKDRISKRAYTLTFQVDNVSDGIYEFGRAVQCGSTAFKFWYANLSHVFGSADGIEPKSADCDFPLDEGRDGKMRAVFTFTYEATVDPERRTNPY